MRSWTAFLPPNPAVNKAPVPTMHASSITTMLACIAGPAHYSDMHDDDTIDGDMYTMMNSHMTTSGVTCAILHINDR